MTALTTLFNRALGVLVCATRQEKEIRGMQIGKEEITLSLFADNVVSYVENSKESTKKLLQLTKLSKVIGYKVNIQKLIVFRYSSNEYADAEIKSTVFFTLVKKKPS